VLVLYTAKMQLLTFALPLLSTLASAHFTLNYPPSRDSSAESGTEAPCGGKSLSSRTSVPLNSDHTLPIALEMGHDETVIQILMSLASNPTEDQFNITLERTFSQTGLGDFCLPSVVIPAGVEVKEGDNATVQVVTDGEGGGGLYAVRSLIPLHCQSPIPISPPLFDMLADFGDDSAQT
jgi:hypothetical protein